MGNLEHRCWGENVCIAKVSKPFTQHNFSITEDAFNLDFCLLPSDFSLFPYTVKCVVIKCNEEIHGI
jgi:hypothetical protein